MTTIILPQIDHNIGPVLCKRCATLLGSIINHKGRPYFFDTVAVILVGFRYCPCCGKVFPWHGNKLDLEQAVRGFGENGKGVKQDG